MTARRRDQDVGVTMWETSVVKNVAGAPLVGLNAIKEERPEVDERKRMWGGHKGLSSGMAGLLRDL